MPTRRRCNIAGLYILPTKRREATRSEDDIWLDTALARLVQIYCGMSLRADETDPIAALAQIIWEQASTRVPLAPDAVCRVPSSSHGESQLGIPPCHLFAWSNSLKVHLLTAA